MAHLSELLNPAPSSGSTSPALPQPKSARVATRDGDATQSVSLLRTSESMGQSSGYGLVPATAYEAARALTALATNSASPGAITTPGFSNLTSPVSRDHAAVHSLPAYNSPGAFSPRLSHAHPRAHPHPHPSGFGPPAIPVEVAAPLGYQTRHPHSPTLEQYHHGSQPPEQRRRSAEFVLASPAVPTILAPIQPRRASAQDLPRDPRTRAIDPPSRNHDTTHSFQPDTEQEIWTEKEMDDTAGEVRQAMDIDLASKPPQTNGHVHDPQPTPDQIMSSAVPAAPSPQPKIKTEPTTTPREGTPHSFGGRTNSLPKLDVDLDTLRAVAELKKDELGLRSASREAATPVTPSMEPPLKPAPAPARKRPAPKATAAAGTKRGAAALKKPPAKKRKSAAAAGTPTSAPASRPRSKKSASNTPAPGMTASPSPSPNGAAPSDADDRSHRADDDDGSDVDMDDTASAAAASVASSNANELFCICRKPDNHTWMIGCDGGCEDWFHGRCVGIRERDGDVIDAYICPNCEAIGRGVTTFRPMCRRDGCRKPARVKTKGKGASRSKYCSDACGLEFMNAMLARSADAAALARDGGRQSPESRAKTGPRRGRTAMEDVVMANGDAEPEMLEDLGPRGGALRPSEVKALLGKSPSTTTTAAEVDAFRKLGTAAATTLPTPTSTTNGDSAADEQQSPTAGLTPDESTRLAHLTTSATTLRARRALLKERERFVSLLAKSAAAATEAGSKAQAACGFDTRLAWNEAQFAAWRASEEGRRAMGEPGPELGFTDVPSASDDMDEEGGGKWQGEVCTRKRCARHAAWQRHQREEALFELHEAALGIRALETEMVEIRQRAALRARTEGEVETGDGAGTREGWVEVCEEAW